LASGTRSSGGEEGEGTETMEQAQSLTLFICLYGKLMDELATIRQE